MQDIKKNSAVIDLFCGIGGLSQGFVLEGYNVISGYDNDKSCRYAFESNNHAKFYEEDIFKLNGKDLNEQFGDKLKILVGCAPCQPFSTYSFRVRKKDPKKINLLYSFSRLIEETQPTIVSMENVPQLVDFAKFTIFQDFCDRLKSLNYFVSYQVVYCPDYGIPQKRKRLVLLASKLGEISLISPTHAPDRYITVRNIIGNLSPVKAGEYDPQDPLHRARKLSDMNLKRIQQAKEGGTWKDWNDELLPECFKRKSGNTYRSVYGRMKWDEPAPTMTTHCTGLGNGRFGHPEQDRAITLREAALIQSFPMEYKFYESIDKYNPSVICKQIGNAVPPKLGQIIAKSIKEHLNKHKEQL
ncbi:MAG: DNA cytosine methyltransferase [Candidatus Symbiothrix sp.]|nr:DNA cytosine methyltransferase [Candidatus Symbiothrix sp.]